jgi:hypothetical protein
VGFGGGGEPGEVGADDVVGAADFIGVEDEVIEGGGGGVGEDFVAFGVVAEDGGGGVDGGMATVNCL